MTTAVNLKDRDFVLVIDRSGSMSERDQKGGLSRWEAARESTIALADKLSRLDPDGFTLYLFNNGHRRFDNVKSNDQVRQIFEEWEPSGSTNLEGVLDAVFTDFTLRKKKNELKPNGEICVLITDGEPDDQKSVRSLSEAFSNTLTVDEEYGLLAIQIGSHPAARAFLKSLDDDKGKGKFDIWDTITMDEVGDRSLTEVLAGAISD